MIRVDVIPKRDALARARRGLPSYGFVCCWDEFACVDLLDGRLRRAFLERFKGRSYGVVYASGFMEFDASKDVSLESGRCIIHSAGLKPIRTVGALHRNYGRSEQEYWDRCGQIGQGSDGAIDE